MQSARSVILEFSFISRERNSVSNSALWSIVRWKTAKDVTKEALTLLYSQNKLQFLERHHISLARDTWPHKIHLFLVEAAISLNRFAGISCHSDNLMSPLLGFILPPGTLGLLEFCKHCNLNVFLELRGDILIFYSVADYPLTCSTYSPIFQSSQFFWVLLLLDTLL